MIVVIIRPWVFAGFLAKITHYFHHQPTTNNQQATSNKQQPSRVENINRKIDNKNLIGKAEVKRFVRNTPAQTIIGLICLFG